MRTDLARFVAIMVCFSIAFSVMRYILCKWQMQYVIPNPIV